MQDPIPDIRQYQDHLENLLRQLKNGLDVQGKAAAAASDSGLDSLDEYILELNTFYYENFHRRFFPLYEQLIKEDIRNLYNISQQESSLKSSLVTALKHNARLFNRVKYTVSVLKQKRQAALAFWREHQQRHEEQTVGLLYILKEAYSSWETFLSFIHNLQVLTADDKLLTALKQYPTHAAAALLFQDWKPDNSKALRDFNRLLASWQLAVKLLDKYQAGSTTDRESSELLTDELRKIDAGWDNRKVPAPVRSWYQQYVQKSYRLYLEALTLSGEKRERRHISRTSVQFTEWLNSLLNVVEQCLGYETRGWDQMIRQLSLLTRTDTKYLKELDDHIGGLVQSMNELIQSLAASSQAEYQNHSRRGMELLSSASGYLQQQIDGPLSSRGMVLAAEIEQLRNQTGLMESRIELLDDREEYSDYAGREYHLIIDFLDSYLEFLHETGEDLKKMWSSHNIKNIFQDMDLKVEHVPIAAGSQFPPQYNYLIESGAVGVQAADAPQGRILHEEGDIFIIHLGEFTENEIPKIIVAKRG